MLHSSDTWAVRMENELVLSRAVMRMVGLMCSVKLSDKVACAGFRERLGGYCGCIAS